MTGVDLASPGSSSGTPVVRGTGDDGVHRVEWTNGAARFICDSPAGSACRSWCVSCDESCPLTDEDGTVHAWEPIQSCRVMDTLNAYGARDTYADDVEVVPEVYGLIDTKWEGETYVWSLQSAEATS